MGDKKVTDLFKVIELLLTSQSSPRTSAEETFVTTISALGLVISPSLRTGFWATDHRASS